MKKIAKPRKPSVAISAKTAFCNLGARLGLARLAGTSRPTSFCRFGARSSAFSWLERKGSTRSCAATFAPGARDLAFLRLFVLDIRSTYLPASLLLDCFFFVTLKSMAERRRAGMQALLLALAHFLIQRSLDALLLVLTGNGHVGINLGCRGVLDCMRHWMKALDQRITLKIVVQEHAAQIWMACVANTVHIIRLALQPVGRWPDRDHAINFRLLVVQAHLDL